MSPFMSLRCTVRGSVQEAGVSASNCAGCERQNSIRCEIRKLGNDAAYVRYFLECKALNTKVFHRRLLRDDVSLLCARFVYRRCAQIDVQVSNVGHPTTQNSHRPSPPLGQVRKCPFCQPSMYSAIWGSRTKRRIASNKGL